MGLRDGIAWRYRLYLAPRLSLDGSVTGALARKSANFFARTRHHPVMYICADSTNVGDYISMLGIRKVVDLPGARLYCARSGLRETFSFIENAKKWHQKPLIIIGGGGLFQECFNDFWKYAVEADIPYAVIGVGCNSLGSSRKITPKPLLASIAETSVGIMARDSYTYNTLRAINAGNVHLGFCPSVEYILGHQSVLMQKKIRETTTLLHIQHPADLLLCNTTVEDDAFKTREAARSISLQYYRTTHISAHHHAILSLYGNARVVVSSRLHGVIISFILKIPCVALSADTKITDFVRTHAPFIPVLPLSYTIDALIEAITTAADQQPQDYEAIDFHSIREKNRSIVTSICKRN